jgi:hypothetical protein
MPPQGSRVALDLPRLFNTKEFEMIDALMNINPIFQPLHSMDFMDANDYVYNSCLTPLLVKNHHLEHMVRDPPYQKNLICFYTIVQRCITPCVMVNVGI